MSPNYTHANPFSLQRGERVQVCPANLTECPKLLGAVVEVDTANRYIAVLFDGCLQVVALPSDDWRFEAEDESIPPVPQEDGLFVTPGDPRGDADLYRRLDGVWTNIVSPDPTAVIAEADLPTNLMPLRVVPKTEPITTPGDTDTTQEVPNV